jgi:hypothetical protein
MKNLKNWNIFATSLIITGCFTWIIGSTLFIINYKSSKPQLKITPGKIYYEYNIIHHFHTVENNPSLLFIRTDTIPIDTIYYPQ